MPTLTQSVGQTRGVSKGLFLDWPKTLVPEGGLTDGQNVEPDLGVVRRVPGWAKYSTTAVPGTGPVMHIAEFVVAAGTRRFMAVTTTRASQYNSSTNVFDDITAGLQLLTGTATDAIFSAVLNDLWVVTNGVNTPKKYNGTTWAALGGSPPASLVGLDVYEGHILGWNTGTVGFRTQWSDLNAPETWTGGEAGTLDIREGNLLAILAGGKMRRQYLFYKEQLGGVYAMTYVGGSLIMQVEELFPRFGVFAPKGVAVYRDSHFVMASDEQLYVISPGAVPQPIGDPVRKRLFRNLNWSVRKAAWVGVHPVKQQVWFVVPEGTATTCTRAYIWHWPTDAWGERELSMQTGALVRDPEVTTINDLVGTIDSLVGTIDSLSQEAKDVFFLGGTAASTFVFKYEGLNTMDGTEIDGWVVGPWVGSGDGRQLRARGVEADVLAGSVAVELGTATLLSGGMTFTALGNLSGGRVDANLSGQYLAPKIRGQAGATVAWDLSGYRLDAYPRGRR